MTYTTIEDQRALPVYGFSSIAIKMDADAACQWFEGEFGSLEGFEVSTSTLEHVEADLVIHNPTSFSYKRDESEPTTPWLRAWEKDMDKADQMLKTILMAIIALCLATLLGAVVSYLQHIL